MTFFSGLDLGKQQDPAAFCVLEQKPIGRPVGRRRWRYDCVHLETWPLGTKYRDIVTTIRERYESPVLRWSRLAPDFGGVGVALVEELRLAKVQCHIRPILSTSGSEWKFNERDKVYHVPKMELYANLTVLTENELVAVDPRLKYAEHLRREIQRYKLKHSDKKPGHISYDAASGSHDDILFALMLAAWIAEREGPGDISGIGLPAEGSGSMVETAPKGVFLS